MLMQTYYKEICYLQQKHGYLQQKHGYLQQKHGYLQQNTLQYAAKCVAFCR